MTTRRMIAVVALILVFTVSVFGLGELSIRYLKNAEEAKDEAIAFQKQGNTKKANKKFEEAIEYYEKVLGQDPNYVGAFNAIVDIHMILGNFDEAEEFAKQFLQRHRNSATLFKLGIIYQRQKDWDKAAEVYNKVIKLPKDAFSPQAIPASYQNLTICYQAKYQDSNSPSDLDLAIQYALESVKLGVPGMQVQLAALYKEKGDVQAGLQAVEDAIQGADDEATKLELRILKASLYEDAGQMDEALKIYDSVVTEDIGADRLNQIAIRYYKTKNFQRAAELFERVINYEPKPKESLILDSQLNAANCYQQLEKEARDNGETALANQYKEKSTKFFELANQASPNDPKALINLADNAYDQKNYERAISYYKKVVDIGKADYSIYMMIGLSYFNLNNWNEAETFLIKATQSEIPRSQDEFLANYYLGLTQFIKGRNLYADGNKADARVKLEEAKSTYQKAINIGGQDNYIELINKDLNSINQLLGSL